MIVRAVAGRRGVKLRVVQERDGEGNSYWKVQRKAWYFPFWRTICGAFGFGPSMGVFQDLLREEGIR